MQRVFVRSRDRQPLDPCHPARARKLLSQGRASVFRLAPFTILLRERTAAQSVTHPLRVKIDPGSRTTGLAVVNDATGQVVWAAELAHRGHQVHERLVARRAIRQGRRQRHTRYRPCRILNRRRPKGNRTPTEWRANDSRCQTVAERARQPLHNAAAVNTTRWALSHRLQASGLPVETGTGGRTMWNRTHRGLDKAHWRDVACVGASIPEHLRARGSTPLAIRAMGRGDRQVCRTAAHGFPMRHRSRVKRHDGFAHGALVRATIPLPSKYAGSYLGRVGVRASGTFDVVDARSGRRAHGIHHRHCRVVQHADGYPYARVAELRKESGASAPYLKAEVSAPQMRCPRAKQFPCGLVL
jgi:hypothetical protein